MASSNSKNNTRNMVITTISIFYIFTIILTSLSILHMVFPNLEWFADSNWERIDYIVTIIVSGFVGGMIKDKVREYL